MLKENERFIDSTVFEGMTSIRAILEGNKSKVNDRRIEKILYDKDKIKKIGKTVGYLKAVSAEYGYTLEETTDEYLEDITLGSSHGGLVAICSERNLPKLADSKDKIIKNGFYAMIDGIEDPYNFGYSLRSLYACGCDGIVLGERNWFSASGVVCRSSAGASEMFNCFVSSGETACDIFKSLGYTIICASEDGECDLGNIKLNTPILLIVGGEKRGISKATLEKCDIKIRIPYKKAFNASLSAASATTMFAYEIMRQNSGK